jgi:DNA-binding MarR family transcriptional regulator
MYVELGGIIRATQLLLFISYCGHDTLPKLTTNQRDQTIRERYRRGERISDLAREFGISPQRVHQIVKPAPKA